MFPESSRESGRFAPSYRGEPRASGREGDVDSAFDDDVAAVEAYMAARSLRPAFAPTSRIGYTTDYASQSDFEWGRPGSLGTDLRADEQCEMEPDHLQVALPISLLVSEPIQCRVPPEKQLTGMLSQVDTTAWESWGEDVSSPDPVMSLPTVELSVQAEIRLNNFSTLASVLIDTEARVEKLSRRISA